MTTELVRTRPVTNPANAEFAADIEDLFVTVVDGYPAGGWGSYDPFTRTVTLLQGLGTVQRRSVLARMLGHAYYNHEAMGAREESEARAWAAHRLISTEQVAATLKAIDWAEVFSRELEVMPSDVTDYLTSMTPDQRADILAALVMAPQHRKFQD
jgi:hypothetical protein